MVTLLNSRFVLYIQYLMLILAFGFWGLVFAPSGGIEVWAKDPIKIGLVLDKGGKDDRSFNEAAAKGLEKAIKELHVIGKVVEASDDHSFEMMIRAFAHKNFDLIILVGVSQVDPLKKVAKKLEKQSFALVDGVVEEKNVKALVFDEHEGSFLVGALAALTSKTGKLGFIGGMDIPLIRRFEMGFVSGAKQAKSGIKVITNYVGVTPEAWNNPAKAKEIALSQYNLGADIIYGAAGGSGLGLFDAAEEKGKFAIGVDLNQNGVRPGHILTSMVKRIDEAVFQAIKETIDGNFKPGVFHYGLANGGVEYSLDEYNKGLISSETIKKIEVLKSKIIAGTIKVPDYYKKMVK